MEYNIEEIKRKLRKYGQEHLLNFYDTLDKKKQEELIKQINNIDFELINSLYNKTKNANKEDDANIEPIDFIDKYKLNGEYKHYEEIGKKAIKEGKLADLVILDKNILKVNPIDIKNIEVLETIKEGKTIFKKL